ncbi:MAG: methyltransferase domain-containing protein, partial [bacterium]
RADVTQSPGIDRLLTAENLTQEPSDSYDVVLSTQVLEHVENPAAYLAECRRILKPGGQLFLTTHGMYEEHGCPHDYFRWTSEGLEKLVASSGFQVVESYKLTTELRCIIQLLFCFAQHLRDPGHPLVHYPLVLGRRVYNRLFCPLLNLVGKTLGRQGVLPAGSPASLYIGVAIGARKQ